MNKRIQIEFDKFGYGKVIVDEVDITCSISKIEININPNTLEHIKLFLVTEPTNLILDALVKLES